MDEAFYLTAEDMAWIRPGLELQIVKVTIPNSRKPVVAFLITDDQAQLLDRDGILTPGAVTTSQKIKTPIHDSTLENIHAISVRLVPSCAGG